MAPKTIYQSAYLRLVGKLRERRVSLGLSQVQLAAHLAWPQQKLSSVETGSRRLDILEFCLITSALGFSSEEMADLMVTARKSIRGTPIKVNEPS
ncbi:helix-turn-helix domain-containing protein [Stenotrophomonas maltophilia]|uniref:helix-turn-helix domain-containing protein n=1 Tax=Stenotrophomonas maltophilia TaxID=40324 RepID=UPI002A92E55E|nr:helix-turn-helix domain-containing protein [Stenotrophomonas maltophilia]